MTLFVGYRAAHCAPLLIDMFRSKKHSQNNDSTQEEGKVLVNSIFIDNSFHFVSLSDLIYMCVCILLSLSHIFGTLSIEVKL